MPKNKGGLLQRAQHIVQRSSNDEKQDSEEGEIGDLFGDFGSITVVEPVSINFDAFFNYINRLVNDPLIISHDLQLIGGDALEQGVQWIYATLQGEGKSRNIKLAVGTQYSANAFRIYWLPWSLQTNFVSWDELDNSGATCFMTVPLSGCMIVIAETGILHVTAGAYKQQENGVRLDLDTDEEAAGSKVVPLDYTFGLTPWPDGYDMHDREVTNRGLVIGFKRQGVWFFYCIARGFSDGRYKCESVIIAEDI